ncbi:MAG: hypothetical protein WD061_02250 [Candidatus Saccharimonadales bacterium]
MSITLNKDQLILMSKKVFKFIAKYSVVFLWLLILVLFGYTLIKTMPISGPEPDENRITEQLLETQQISINIDEELKKQIDARIEVDVDTSIGDLGTQDPFSP